MKSPVANAIATILALLVICLWFAFCSGCTIKVEPLPKPKPKVKYKTKIVHHRKARSHGTPSPHGMIVPDEPTKLIEHPTPQP